MLTELHCNRRMRGNSAGVRLFFLAWLVGLCWSQSTNYDFQKDGVIELTNSNFQDRVLGPSTGPWLVLFEAPGDRCPQCVQITPFIKGAVQGLKDKNIQVGIVNGLNPENYYTLTQRYQLNTYGYPAAFVLGKDKENPIRIPLVTSSPKELIGIVDFFYNRPTPANGQCGTASGPSPNSNTYELTDDNFDEVVLKCPDPFVINFYAPYIESCGNFVPVFEQAAKQFEGKAKFGLFFQLGSKVAEKYDAGSRVCSVKMFPAGDKSGNPVDYNLGNLGPPIDAGLITWIQSKVPA